MGLRKCITCIHFGEVRRKDKTYMEACFAPITTEPPKDGMTRASHTFAYETTIDSECELWTGFSEEDQT